MRRARWCCRRLLADGTKLPLFADWRAELKMALPLPAPTESSVHGYASGITTGTLGTYCLPDTDCGLVILRKLGLVGQSEYHTLSFHPSLLEGNPMLEELVATKHPFSFKGKGHGLTYM